MAKPTLTPSNTPVASSSSSQKRAGKSADPRNGDGTVPPHRTQLNVPENVFITQPIDCGLYVVATPIGNLMDFTLRAIDVLKQVDVIACEDTRITGKLLKHFGISTPMVVYNDHTGQNIRPKLLSDLKKEKRIALVSDAGTPLISDPGYKLVSDCIKNNIRVSPIPGASAMLAGLVVSGLPTDKVLFAGFLPSKKKARQSEIEKLSTVEATLIFYETGPRICSTLVDLAELLGQRSATVARELTKLYEETTSHSLVELIKIYGEKTTIKGEVVIIVGPPQDALPLSSAETDTALLDALETMSIKDAATTVAELTGQPKRMLYTRALQLKEVGSESE